MQKRFALFVTALMAVVLVGAGCSTTETTDTTTNETAEVTEETTEVVEEVTGPVAFSEVGESMLSSKFDSDTPEGYTSYDFTEGTGTCVDQGLTEFSYLQDEELGYFVVTADVLEYQEDLAGLSFMGHLNFDEVPLGDQSAKCQAKSETGNDEATLTCTVDEVEVCTGTYMVYANK